MSIYLLITMIIGLPAYGMDIHILMCHKCSVYKENSNYI